MTPVTNRLPVSMHPMGGSLARRVMLAAAALLLAIGVGAQAQEAKPTQPGSDGPYITSDAGDRWTARSLNEAGVATEHGRLGGRIRIPAADGVPAFTVPIRNRPPVAPSQLALDRARPLMVVADTHGEFGILVNLLRSQKIVDARLGWHFGTGHLVVTGDMLDRGPHHLEILWLLYKLEAEASKVGGAVHVLLGNHEAMVLRGDLRYLNPRYPAVAQRLGASTYSELLDAGTVLGAWLRSRPAMLKLGDLLFLHGGVSPALTASPLGLDAINDIVRRNIDVPADRKPSEGTPDALVMGTAGPLWYRGYFGNDDKPAVASASDVDAALERFAVSRILVGHTIVDQVTPLYDGKVIAVQVYPHRDERSGAPVLEGALRINGQWYRATAQGQRTPLGVN